MDDDRNNDERNERAHDELRKRFPRSAETMNRNEAMGEAAEPEADHKLCIPRDTEPTLARAIRRYWSVWPAQRDAVLGHYTDAVERLRKRGVILGERPSAKILNQIRKSDAEAWGLVAFDAYYSGSGGPLGLELLGHETNFGIAIWSELSFIASTSTEDLCAWPPVQLSQHIGGAADRNRDDLGQPIDNEASRAVFISGQTEGIALSNLVDHLPPAKTLYTILTADKPYELAEVRAAYRDFARTFWSWFNAQGDGTIGLPVITSLPGLFSTPLAKQTFYPLHRIEQAYSDVAGFEPTRDGRALVHRIHTKERKRDPIEVVLAPLEDPEWFPRATVGDLKDKLLAIGTSASFTFAVAVSLAIEHEFVDLELDDFIKLLGLDPRSSEERNKHRTLLWESLKLFSQTSAVGELRGTYRDGNGNQVKRIEESPIIAITGKQYPAEMRLDRSETPIAVSFVPGNFLRRNRSDRKMLASLGDLRQLAAIPSGKVAGRWARTIGLALLQYWREGAADADMKRVGEDSHLTFLPKPITRRRLFERMRPDPDPFEILKSNDPSRARKYWDEAIEMLRLQKSVQCVSKTQSILPRKGWQDAWLDEALDLRPHHKNVAAIVGVQSVADGAKAWRKKRGRPKKKGATPPSAGGNRA